MSQRIPSLNWLRVFEMAARTESFARAAERLAMSRPAVSQQIRALEAHLGQELFIRQAAGVALTEAGRSLLGVVADALGQMESAASALSQTSMQKLVIGVSLTLSSGWLLPRLPAFLKAHPKLLVEVHSMVGRPETPPLQADLWIAFGQAPPGTTAHFMFGERLFPVAHPDVARMITSLDDLERQAVIEVLDHRRNWLQVLPGEIALEQSNTVYVDTTSAALALAAAKGGIALARAPASDDLVRTLDLKRCLPDIEVRGVEAYQLMYASNTKVSAGVVAFRNWLLAEANKA